MKIFQKKDNYNFLFFDEILENNISSELSQELIDLKVVKKELDIISKRFYKIFDELHFAVVILKKDKEGYWILVDFNKKAKEIDKLDDSYKLKKLKDIYYNLDKYGISNIFNNVYDDGIPRNHEGYYVDNKIYGYRKSYIYSINITDKEKNLVSIYEDITFNKYLEKYNKVLKGILKYKNYIGLFILFLFFSIFLFDKNETKYDINDDIYVDVFRTNNMKNSDSCIFYFNNKQYQRYIKCIEDENILKFYNLGISYMMIKEYEKAIEYFDMIENDNSNLFIDQSEWFKVLSYIELKNNEKIIESLEKIIKQGEYHYKYNEALVLYNKYK